MQQTFTTPSQGNAASTSQPVRRPLPHAHQEQQQAAVQGVTQPGTYVLQQNELALQQHMQSVAQQAVQQQPSAVGVPVPTGRTGVRRYSAMAGQS